MKNNSPIIIGLDIGTTKVVAIAGVKNEHGQIEVIGFGKSISKGVEHGLVLNIEQCVNSIREAIKNCRESNPNLEINNVYIGIAGKHIKSIQNRGERIRSDVDSLITKTEIDLLIQDQRKTYLPPGDKIIDIVPQDFAIDDMRNILNPIGRRGTKLGANFHIITGAKSDIQNINMCVRSAHLDIAEIVLQPMASAAAVMSEEELEMGVAIVDIGGGTTDMAVFKEGILHHTSVIPFAGDDITNDIKQNLGILKTQAELMKVKYGSALESDKYKNAIITIPGIRGHQRKEIAYNSLAKIIQCRIQDIMNAVMNELQSIGMHDQLHAGIILTGGGAFLQNIKPLTEFVTKMNVRIGFPDERLHLDEKIEQLKNPMYSTCIGLVLKGFDDYETGKVPFHSDLHENRVFAIRQEPNYTVDELAQDTQNEFVEEEEIFTNETIEKDPEFVDETPQTFNLNEEDSEEIDKHRENVRKRGSAVNKIFNSIKPKLLNFFDGEHDDELQE